MATFNGKLQVDWYLGDSLVLREMDAFPKYAIFTPVRPKNPLEVRDAFAACWVSIFGPPRAMQMDEGGEWKHEVWADFCADRQIKLFSQGVGAHPWILERRNGLARGIYNRIRSDGRFSGKRILAVVHWRSDTLISATGNSAFQLALAPTHRIVMRGKTTGMT